MSIKSQQFTKEILRQLQEYTSEVIDEVNDKAAVISKTAVKELKATSPKVSGDYAKSWKIKSQRFYNAPTRYIIYNKDHYRLTHVLEYGHAVKGGTERSQAVPHIKQVEEKTVNAYIEAVKDVIRHGG